MSEFPGIESLNTRSRWSTYDVKNDVEKTCQIEAETNFNNLTCLQVSFYQIMLFTSYLNQEYVTNVFFSVFLVFRIIWDMKVLVIFLDKVQLLWEGRKNIRHPPYGFEV